MRGERKGQAKRNRGKVTVRTSGCWVGGRGGGGKEKEKERSEDTWIVLYE